MSRSRSLLNVINQGSPYVDFAITLLFQAVVKKSFVVKKVFYRSFINHFVIFRKQFFKVVWISEIFLHLFLPTILRPFWALGETKRRSPFCVLQLKIFLAGKWWQILLEFCICGCFCFTALSQILVTTLIKSFHFRPTCLVIRHFDVIFHTPQLFVVVSQFLKSTFCGLWCCWMHSIDQMNLSSCYCMVWLFNFAVCCSLQISWILTMEL